MLTNASDYIDILHEAQKYPSDKTLLIFDEVHRLPEPKRKNQTLGLHKIFGYKIGLSATIENEYNPDQKDFIANEIGDCIAKYVERCNNGWSSKSLQLSFFRIYLIVMSLHKLDI